MALPWCKGEAEGPFLVPFNVCTNLLGRTWLYSYLASPGLALNIHVSRYLHTHMDQGRSSVCFFNDDGAELFPCASLPPPFDHFVFPTVKQEQ